MWEELRSGPRWRRYLHTMLWLIRVVLCRMFMGVIFKTALTLALIGVIVLLAAGAR